jgi:OFA family oxalate/formate antiporter-like MFS transporter
MAIGIVTAGIALGGVLFPLGIQRIIAVSGWTQALYAMAALQLLICLPIVALLVRDSPEPIGLRQDGDPIPAENSGPGTTGVVAAEGMTFAEAVRSMDFWLLASVFFLVGLTVFAVVTNSVHILKQTASLDIAQVAKVQAMIGVTILVGRLIIGALLDHFSDRWAGLVVNVLAAIGFVGYAMSDNLVMAMMSGALLGFAVGGEGNILPYMVAKYFGQRSFGKILGVSLGIFGLGTALGPVAYAWLVELTGSIQVTLQVFAALVFISAVNFLFLGRRKLSSSGQESRERCVTSNAK